MDILVNKRVRLRNRLTNSTLVASSDKESVTHVVLNDNNPKPENTVWVIKSKNPDKSVRLESVYGKVLGWSLSKEGTSVYQTDKCAPNKEDTTSTGKWRTWWILEDVDNNGFACVQIRDRHFKGGAYVFADVGTPQVMLRRSNFSWWSSWFMERMFYWDLEIVNTSAPAPTPTPTICQDRAICNKPGDSHKLQEHADGNHGIPSSAYTYQVSRMYVRNIYKAKPGEVPAPSVPFMNYDVNSGCNNNESGSQIIGDTIVQTRIGRFVNNNNYQT